MTSPPSIREEAVHQIASRLANTAQVLEAFAGALDDPEDLLRRRLDRAIAELGDVVGALTVPDAEFLLAEAGGKGPAAATTSGSEATSGPDETTGLSGRSEMISLVEFITFLSSVSKSGVLRVQSEGAEYVIELHEGNVVYAALEPEPPSLRLSRILLDQGALSETDLEVGSENRDDGEPLGQSLMRQGLVEKDALVTALFQQAMLIFRTAHTVGAGYDFQFEEHGSMGLPLDLQAGTSYLLLESARLLDEEANEAAISAKAAAEEAQATEVEGEGAEAAPDRDTLEEFRSRLRAALDADELELPVLPDATGKLLALCWSDEHDPAELLACVNRDQALSAHLLRMANSAAYASLTPISSVQLAIARLGLTKLREVAMALTLKKELFQVPRWESLTKSLWYSAAVTCGFGGAVGRACSTGAGRGGTAGLLLDVGKPIVLGELHAIQEELDVELELEAVHVLMEEFHAEMGALLAEQWSLPGWLKAVVRHHHDYADLEEHRVEVLVGNLACELADIAVREEEADTEALAALPVCEELGMGPVDIQEILGDTKSILDMAGAYA